MIHKTIVIAILFLGGQIIIPSFAVTAESNPPGESPFTHGFTDIKLLDAYFGTPSMGKIETEPGDQNVPLTVVFSAVGTEDLTGIKGLLSLPVGFSSANANADLIESENTQVAPSGASFPLTFFVNIDKNTNAHSYTGTVKVTYSRVRESGITTNFFDFDFKVTGKSLLNGKVENPFLQPATNNKVTVKMSNNGTAAINNLDITLVPQSNSSNSNLGNIIIDEKHWNLGTINAQSSKTFSFNAFIPPDLAAQVLHPTFTATYLDGQGNQVTASKTVDIIVSPSSSTFNIKLSTPPFLMMGVMQNLTLGLENLSPSKISNIAVKLVPSSSDLKILQDPRWFIDNINPLEKATLNIPVFANENISNQAVNFDATILYTKDGSTGFEKQSFATYIRPVIDISVYGIEIMNIGGKQNIIGNILNQGNIKGQFATVTVEPIDNSNIKKSFYYIGDLDIDAPTPFNVPIEFIGEPTSGEHKVVVTVTYKDSLLQPHTITQDDTITLADLKPQTSDNSQIQLVILIAIAAGIGGIVFKIRKAKIPITKKVKENSS